jgi:hypothetical protein
VPVQAPPFGSVSALAAGALKTDNRLSTFLLLHLGQLILSRVDKTMVSNCWSQPRQVSSLRSESQITDCIFQTPDPNSGI